MEFESFKDYIEHENEVYQKMAEDAIWDLKHNPLYNGTYTRFYSRNDYDYDYDYDYDGYEDGYDCEYGDICENSFEKRHRAFHKFFHKFHHRLNEAPPVPAPPPSNPPAPPAPPPKPRDLTDAEKKQIENLCNTYNTCTQYLGLLRMEKLIEKLNECNGTWLFKLYQKEKDFRTNGGDPDKDPSFIRRKEVVLKKVFSLMIKSINIEDKTGREDIAIKLDKGKKKYIIVNKNKPNEVVKESLLVAGGLLGAGLALIAAVLYKFGKKFIDKLKNRDNDGTPCKGNHLDDLYAVDRNKVDEKSTDEEKAKMKVLWTKKIEPSDITVFKDPDPNCNFFKQVVCLTYKFGPKSIDELTNLCIKSRNSSK